MIVLVILYISTLIGIGIYYINKNFKMTTHKHHVLVVQGGTVGGGYFLVDKRVSSCKKCRKHNWGYWDANLCICDRCLRIRQLEIEIFGGSSVNYDSEVIKGSKEAYYA